MRLLTGRAGKSKLMQELSRKENPLHIVDCVGGPIWLVDNRVGVASVNTTDLERMESMVRIVAEDRRDDRDIIYVYANISPENKEHFDLLGSLEEELNVQILVTVQTDDEEVMIRERLYPLPA